MNRKLEKTLIISLPRDLSHGYYIHFFLYVDDFLIAGKEMVRVNDLKVPVKNEFEM